MPGVKPQIGLSMTSLILGILSPVCFFIITGIPAIITGHIAYSRSRKQPQAYGGAGMALAGLILGYIGIFMTLLVSVLAALILPAIAAAKKSQSPFMSSPSQCVNNMKQIGLAARIWSNDHNDTYPPDFLTMSNELYSPKILVCPNDSTKTSAPNWVQFRPSQNVTYEFLTPGAKEADIMTQAAFRCPIHNNITLGDGSVQQSSGRKR